MNDPAVVTRRVVVLLFAAGFCVGDWLLDRVNKRLCARLAEQQERYAPLLDDLLADPLTLEPWRTP